MPPLDAPHADDLQLKEFPVEIERAKGAPRFVLSASSPDRVRDTFDPAAYQPHVGKKMIALWQHDRANPIGYWQNLKAEGGKLIGDLVLAGTQLAKMVKQLIDDDVPLFASIGYRGKGEPNAHGGVHVKQFDLVEVSVVSVPAHPQATLIAKSFGFDLASDGRAVAHATARAPSAAPRAAVAAPPVPPRGTKMPKTISQLVQETQQQQVALVDRLAAETTKLGELTDGTDEFTTHKALVDEITAQLATCDGKLETLKSAEARLAKGASAAGNEGGGGAPAIVKHVREGKDTENLLGRLAICVYEATVKQLPITEVAAQRFGNSDVMSTFIKAAQNPAMSNVPGYAQELTRIGYGQLMEALRAEALLPKLVPLGQQHTFDGHTSITYPIRSGTPTDAAAAFRAEGAPIRVGGLTFTSGQLTPKNMGVILTATQEMLRRSIIDLPSYFQNAMVTDTRTALDAVFLGNSAGTALQPPGIRNGLAAGDTRASTGATATAIATDLKTMIIAMANNLMGGPNTRWLMHPKNFVSVSWLQLATGQKAFPETANGSLAGYPVIQSTAMPTTIVLLVDFDQFSFAMGNPAFEPTNVATLHEESATPLPIASAGSPNTVAAPVRSLYQTNSWAIRMLLDVDWAKMRNPGPVQELTAVAW